MQGIINFFSNSWVSSLATGIIVYFASEFFNGLREKKQYFIRVKQADAELYNTLKMLIPENKLPEVEILYSLFHSTAYKYTTKITDMRSLQDICDDLIKDVIESNYLAYEDKLNYCAEIKKAKSSIIQEENVNKVEIETSNSKVNLLRLDKANRLVSISSILAIASALLAMYLQLKDFDIPISEFENVNIFIGFLVIMIMIITVMQVILVLFRAKRSKKDYEKRVNAIREQVKSVIKKDASL